MPTPRIWVRESLPRAYEAGSDSSPEIQLDGEAAHHVARVLRSRKGEHVVLFDGNGGEHHAALVEVAKGRVTARLESFDPVDRESPLRITLLLGLSRGERMDFALQKTTELGVTEIAPIVTARSVVRLDLERAQRRAAHWRQVIVSACEQSGRTRIPLLHPPLALSERLQATPLAPLRLALDPRGAPPATDTSAETGVAMAVGPEGGFEQSELEQLTQHGFDRIRLGPRVLRTETAAAAAVLFTQTTWGDIAHR